MQAVFKLTLVGERGVGKSSAVFRFINDSFDKELYHDPCLEDYYEKELSVDEDTVRVEILDTGQYEDHSAMHEYVSQSPFFFLFSCFSSSFYLAQSVFNEQSLSFFNVAVCHFCTPMVSFSFTQLTHEHPSTRLKVSCSGY